MTLCSNCGWDVGNQMLCPRCATAVPSSGSAPPRATAQSYASTDSPQVAPPPPVPGTGASTGARPGAGTYSPTQRTNGASAVGGFAMGCGVAALIAMIFVFWFLSQLTKALSSGDGMHHHIFGIVSGPGAVNAAIAVMWVPFRRVSLGQRFRD